MLKLITALICALLLVVACSKTHEDELGKNIGDQITHSRK